MEMVSPYFSARASGCKFSSHYLLYFFCTLFLALLSFGPISVAHASETEDFTVVQVGISTNSNTVIIWTQEDASDTTCNYENQFRISLPSTEAYMVYSAALSAMYEGKKVSITYSETECINNGSKLEVFRNLNY